MENLSDIKGKKKVILKFNLEDLKKIKLIDDFFLITGITPYLKDLTIHDVRQMEMNEEDGKSILDYWLKNWNKIKEIKGYRKPYAQSKISFTWMNYAPVYNAKCPRGELWLFPKKKVKEIKK